LPLPVVADASGLAWLPATSPRINAPRVITPHPGEAARMLGLPNEEIEKDRARSARMLAERYRAVIALKGNQTIVCERQSPLFINSSGSSDLAQGGSGDVLAGYVAGLLAQPALQKDPLNTVRYAVWQHGAAADKLSAERSNWTIEDLIYVMGAIAP